MVGERQFLLVNELNRDTKAPGHVLEGEGTVRLK